MCDHVRRPDLPRDRTEIPGDVRTATSYRSLVVGRPDPASSPRSKPLFQNASATLNASDASRTTFRPQTETAVESSMGLIYYRTVLRPTATALSPCVPFPWNTAISRRARVTPPTRKNTPGLRRRPRSTRRRGPSRPLGVVMRCGTPAYVRLVDFRARETAGYKAQRASLCGVTARRVRRHLGQHRHGRADRTRSCPPSSWREPQALLGAGAPQLVTLPVNLAGRGLRLP